MKNLLLLFSVLLISACSNCKQSPVVKVVYRDTPVVYDIDERYFAIPDYSPIVIGKNSKQSDVALLIVDDEKMIDELKLRIKTIKEVQDSNKKRVGTINSSIIPPSK